MASFNSSIAGHSSSFNIRYVEDSDPNDDSYQNSDNNSVESISKIFKKLLKKSEEFKNEKGNKPNFKFTVPKSYLIKEGLISFELLNINYSQPRKVLFKCTMPNCSWKTVFKAVRPQISLNGTDYYKRKH